MDLEENVLVKTGKFRLLAGILIAVFIFAVGGIGGYWVGSRQQQSSLTALQTSPKPSWLSSTPSVKLLSPTPTIATSQTDPLAWWNLYKNDKYGFVIRYPLWVKVEELSAEGEAESTFTNRFSIKFYSPEAAPNAVMPQDSKDANQFVDKYFLVVLQVYDNSSNLPLKQALKESYAIQSLIPRKTIFELMESRLRLYNDGLHDGLIFTGISVETPQKSIFLSYKNNIFAITLYGGPSTGTNYSASSERIFDMILSSLQLK